MALEDQDVDQVSSSGETPTPESDGSGEAPVNEPTDRPVQNIKAEFDRKLGQFQNTVQSQLAQIAQSIASLQRPAQVANPGTREYTDDELWAMGQSGSREASDMYHQRQLDRRMQVQTATSAIHQQVAGQLQALARKYPVLSDSSHPLTIAALQAKAALVSMGYQADAPATVLEAIKVAIADNPEIIAGLVRSPQRASEGARGSAANAQMSVDGNTPRRAQPKGQAAQISDKEKAIAQRMGVKDPAKARERFEKRNAAGRSSISPAIALLVREDN